MTLESEPKLEHWEGVYPLPPAGMPCCSWCRKPGAAWFVVVFRVELSSVTRDVQSWVVCETCAEGGRDYISLRKAGVSHRNVLRDFCIRE